MTFTSRLGAIFGAADTLLQRQAVWLSAIALLFTLQTVLIVTHQPWADEWQAALIALEAPDWGTMLAWLKYEGHPPLWYAFLRVLGWVFDHGAVLWIAALICAFVVQAGILFAAPFTRLERILLVSSHYVLFEFLTISRGTTLGVALLVLAMLSWRTKWFWLIMALLPMVDFLFGVISGIFLILQWRERRLWWPGIAVWLAGSALAAWSIIPAPDMINALDAMKPVSGGSTLSETATAWFLRMGSLPIPFQGGIFPEWNRPVVPIAGLAWILMAALCWILTRGQVWHRLMIFGFFGLTLVMSLAIYPLGLRHMMIGTFLLLLLVWRQRANTAEQSLIQTATLRVWLVLLAACGLASSAISATRGFDSAPLVAAEIKRLNLEDKHWVILPEWRSAAIAGRSDVAFVRPAEQCTFTYVRWNYSYEALASSETFKTMLYAHLENHGRFYLVSELDFNGFPPDLIAPLAQIPAGYSGVEYKLYVVGKGKAEKPVNLPRCYTLAPDQRSAIP